MPACIEVFKWLIFRNSRDVSNLRIELKDGSNKSNDKPLEIMVQDINS